MASEIRQIARKEEQSCGDKRAILVGIKTGRELSAEVPRLVEIPAVAVAATHVPQRSKNTRSEQTGLLLQATLSASLI